MRGRKGGLSRLVESNNADVGQVSCSHSYSNVPETGGSQMKSSLNQTAFIHDFVLYFGLF